MSKILSIVAEQKCIGCGLCVIKSSLLVSKNKISSQKSFIRIFGKPKKPIISVDYGQKTGYKELVDICPQRCFELKNG